MAEVLVASARFASLLANRGMTVEHCASGLTEDIDLGALSVSDQILSFDQLEALAKRFKKTWPYFLIDSPEAPPRYGTDHRTVANRRQPLSSMLLDQVFKAESMLEWAAELFPEIAFEVPTPRITKGTDMQQAAERIRELLGVSFDDQLATKDDYAALRLWSEALQARGLFVQMRRLDDPTVRAFSLVAGEQAVVVADTQDVPYARLFSLLHEYTHIVLRSAGLCDLDDHALTERYCNAVAACVLMPASLMRREVRQDLRWGKSLDDDEARVSSLSVRLGVSKASVLVRLHVLGTISDAVYDELEERRRSRPGKTRTPGGRYHLNAINKVGRQFARRVVRAYEAGSIDRLDASTLLEIPEHNFPNFAIELRKSNE